jgi:hypothetical protein
VEGNISLESLAVIGCGYLDAMMLGLFAINVKKIVKGLFAKKIYKKYNHSNLFSFFFVLALLLESCKPRLEN